MICQSIIPGILNNTDLSKLAEYGTVDDKKNIVASDGFHQLMLKIADAMSIKVNKVLDPVSGKSIEIAGSTEVKGIKGSDNRYYLVDLQGLAPRDANYKGEDNHTCLLRHELVANYQKHKQLEYAQEHMKEFAKKLEEDRDPELKPEEGKQFTEEQKKKYVEARQQEHEKQLKELDRLMKEAPTYKFNVNVFKESIQLDMKAEEIQAEERQVEDLAKYLKETVIETLVLDLKQLEGVPTDSESLTNFFHKRGVNMRYLGQVIKALSTVKEDTQKYKASNDIKMEGEFKHLKTNLEREIIMRSAKHVFNKILREDSGESELHQSQIVAHLLNCLLAPSPQQESLNSGQIKLVDQSLQTKFEFFPTETLPSPRRGSFQEFKQEVKPDQRPEEPKEEEEEAENIEVGQDLDAENANLTKAQRKRLAKKFKINFKSSHFFLSKKQKKQQSPDKITKKANQKKCTDMSDLLFKQIAAENATQEAFRVEDLFQSSILSNSLHRLVPPTALNLKPSEIFQQIRQIAEARFDYQIPDDLSQIGCLQNINNKTSLLRDLCKCIGVQLQDSEKREYLIGNSLQDIVSFHQQLQAQEATQAQSSKKKKSALQTVIQVTEAEVLSDYKHLPFQAEDIQQMFPVVKKLDRQSSDTKGLIVSASQAYKAEQLEKSFELFTQAINLSLQMTGPMNEEIATCLGNISSLQFKFGDFLQAIELQTKAIVLQERLIGLDHPHVAFNYSTLAMYYHNCAYYQKGFEYMYRALNILKMSAGEYHPEIGNIYLNLGLMYQEIQALQEALEVYQLHLLQMQHMFGETHMQTASSYQAIAVCYYRMQDFRQALTHQEKAYEILKKILPGESPIIGAAKQQFDMYFRLSVNQEKQKSVFQRPIGSNKEVVNPKIMSAIQEARQRAALQQKEGQEKKNETEEERQKRIQQEQLQQSYAQLMQRLQNPKTRTHLDILQYQHIQQQQAAYLQTIQQNAAKMQAEKEKKAGESNEAAKEEDKKE